MKSIFFIFYSVTNLLGCQTQEDLNMEWAKVNNTLTYASYFSYHDDYGDFASPLPGAGQNTSEYETVCYANICGISIDELNKTAPDWKSRLETNTGLQGPIISIKPLPMKPPERISIQAKKVNNPN